MHVGPEVRQYCVELVGATRRLPDLRLGASPRATLQLVRAARAQAALSGRGFVVPDDVQAVAVPVLAHRLLLTPDALAARRSAADLVRGAGRAAAGARRPARSGLTVPTVAGRLSGLTTRGRCLLAGGVATAVCAVVLDERDLLRIGAFVAVAAAARAAAGRPRPPRGPGRARAGPRRGCRWAAP